MKEEFCFDVEKKIDLKAGSTISAGNWSTC